MKSKLIKEFKQKKAQDEMVGFGLIIMVVAVILLVFVGSTISRTRNQIKEIDDYETNAFVQATLQYTTICRVNSESLNVEELIFECANEEVCENNRPACQVLEGTIRDILERSWKTGSQRVTEGYELVILVNPRTPSQEVILRLTEGELDSKNYRANPPARLTKNSNDIEFYFTAFYES